MKRRASSPAENEPAPKRRRQTCQFGDCGKRPSFGLAGGKPTHCGAHRTPDMRNVVSSMCQFDGCSTGPSFGLVAGKPTHCAAHRAPDMRDVKSKTCQFDGCVVHPAFGLVTGKPTHCAAHRTPDMRDVKSKTCQFDGCGKQPAFGLAAGKPTRCAAHRAPDMRNVVTQTCQFDGCVTRPTFGLVAGKPTRCAAHHAPDMRDVVTKTCQFDGCTTVPAFGLAGGKPTHCGAHRTPDMRDVKSKTCQFDGCVTRPSYGLVAGKPTHCAAHRAPDMRDMMNRTCQFDGCVTRPWYGEPGLAVTACAAHRTAGMIVYSNRRCIISTCREIAVFGTIGRQLHCETHAVAGEINLIERACASCGLLNIIHPVTKLCGYCDPAQKACRPVKRKELEIKGLLESEGWRCVHDQRLADPCGLRDRPDFVIDVGYCIVIIEVDEHQHREYMCARVCECPESARHCKCQQARMIDIGQVAGMPTVWIRYNPDAFQTMTGQSGKVSGAARRQALARMVKYIAAQNTDWLEKAFTTACYMYYDGEEVQWETLV